MRASLASETDRRVIFFSETLDSQRFAMETLEREIAAQLAKRYNALRIHVVVAVSRTAFRTPARRIVECDRIQS